MMDSLLKHNLDEILTEFFSLGKKKSVLSFLILPQEIFTERLTVSLHLSEGNGALA